MAIVTALSDELAEAGDRTDNFTDRILAGSLGRSRQ